MGNHHMSRVRIQIIVLILRPAVHQNLHIVYKASNHFVYRKINHIFRTFDAYRLFKYRLYTFIMEQGDTKMTYLIRLSIKYIVKIPLPTTYAPLGFLTRGHRQAGTLREILQQHHVVKRQTRYIPTRIF